MLPMVVQWIEAVLMLASVAGIGWIGFMQVRIAAARYKLDLYGKRFKVFQATSAYIQCLLHEGKISEADLNKFNLGVAGAPFLFENDVNIYLDALRRRSLSMTALSDQLVSIGATADGRDDIIDRIEAWLADFKTEYSRLVIAFTPYLKNRGI
jgi:hypothetical protein